MFAKAVTSLKMVGRSFCCRRPGIPCDCQALCLPEVKVFKTCKSRGSSQHAGNPCDLIQSHSPHAKCNIPGPNLPCRVIEPPLRCVPKFPKGLPRNPCKPFNCAEDFVKYKRIFLYLCLPIIWLQLLKTMNHPAKRPKKCKNYEYLRIRNKKYPWGNGVETFFHNPHMNLLPGECPEYSPPKEFDVCTDPGCKVCASEQPVKTVQAQTIESADRSKNGLPLRADSIETSDGPCVEMISATVERRTEMFNPATGEQQRHTNTTSSYEHSVDLPNATIVEPQENSSVPYSRGKESMEIATTIEEISKFDDERDPDLVDLVHKPDSSGRNNQTENIKNVENIIIRTANEYTSTEIVRNSATSFEHDVISESAKVNELTLKTSHAELLKDTNQKGNERRNSNHVDEKLVAVHMLHGSDENLDTLNTESPGKSEPSKS